jgi:hypothetical protein
MIFPSKQDYYHQKSPTSLTNLLAVLKPVSCLAFLSHRGLINSNLILYFKSHLNTVKLSKHLLVSLQLRNLHVNHVIRTMKFNSACHHSTQLSFILIRF